MRSGRSVARGAAKNALARREPPRAGDRRERARRLADELQQLGRDLVDEAAARVDLEVAEDAPAPRVRQIELLHRARHADVAEAALLLDVVVVDARVREEALLHAGHEHDGNSSPFAACRVISVTRSAPPS